MNVDGRIAAAVNPMRSDDQLSCAAGRQLASKCVSAKRGSMGFTLAVLLIDIGNAGFIRSPQCGAKNVAEMRLAFYRDAVLPVHFCALSLATIVLAKSF